MWPVGRREKKLTVAFHFQFANQAAWKCDDCRRSGLERKRNCGFLFSGDAQSTKVIWARKTVATASCPKSYITADSLAWIESFEAWKRAGGSNLFNAPARQADAFHILESELSAEMKNAETRH